jgi:hypothetical protein
VREISGPVLADYNKAGIQSACWDLRVQPAPAPALGRGGEGRGDAGRQGGQSDDEETRRNPFGAGCGGGGGGFGGGGGRGGGGGASPGPFVLPGVYNVSLVVDGKSVDTKPLRVLGDPQVVLTEAERKKMFDMAMEMHELQRRVTDVANSLAPVSRQLPEVAKTVAGRTDLPADVKSSFDAFNAELSALMTRLAAAAGGGGRGGGGGGGRGGPDPNNPFVRLGQAKNGLIAGMPVTAMTTQAYNDAKAQIPKAITEATSLLSKAQAMSTVLATHNITLTVPAPNKPTTSSSNR